MKWCFISSEIQNMRQCRLHWKWGHRRSIYSCTKKTLYRRSKSSGKEGWNAIVYPWGMDEVANWPVIHVINVLLYQHVDGAYMVLFCVLSYPLWQVVNNCAIPHSCSYRPAMAWEHISALHTIGPYARSFSRPFAVDGRTYVMISLE